jgi:hypothetical protein
MSLTKNTSRKTQFIAEVTVSHADLTSAVALPAIDMPSGTVVDDVKLIVDELFDPTTSAVIEVGIGGDTNKFVASQNVFTGQALGGRAGDVVGAGYKFTAPDTIDVLYTSGGGTATEGIVRLIVSFHYENESDFTVAI